MEHKSIVKCKEGVVINYEKCPRCGNEFDKGKHRKTKNHAIPQFLKPKTNIIHTLCLECHKELNSYYKIQEIQAKKYRVKSKDFEEFMNNYQNLREEFYDKKLNRGQFGEGLWSNIITLLDSFNERLKQLEGKGGKEDGKKTKNK